MASATATYDLKIDAKQNEHQLLAAMYEAATVDDLYEVYAQLGLGDGEIFTCVTVACFAAYVSFASYNVVEFIVPGGLFGYSTCGP